MKAHIGVDGELGPVHCVAGPAVNVADVTQVNNLLHGEESMTGADMPYSGAEKHPEHEGLEVIRQIAARHSTYKQRDKRSAAYKTKRKIENAKARLRAKVEHPLWVIKLQFGHVNTRFRGLAKNMAQLVMLFALSSLWMARRYSLTIAGEVSL